MIYRKSTKQRVALAALVAATATVVTLDFRENPGGPISRVQDVAVSIVAPLQDGMARVFRPVGSFLSGLGSIGTLREENSRLAAENERLKAEQRRFPAMVLENQRLLDLVGQKDWTQGRTLGARVIGLDPSNQEWTVVLNKGEAEGVKVNMSVVSAEGLVGRVVRVTAGNATVLMVIDPEHAVGARLTATGETGVVTGRGEEELKFEFIDPDTQIASGETVVTSGYDKGIYPPNIPIGRVSRVIKARDGLSKVAFVAPFVDFTKLDTVLILLDSGPAEGAP